MSRTTLALRCHCLRAARAALITAAWVSSLASGWVVPAWAQVAAPLSDEAARAGVLPPGHPPVSTDGGSRDAPAAEAAMTVAGPVREVGLDAVEVDIQCQLDPGDSGLTVTQELRFVTPPGTRHNVTEKDPLRLPLLVPAVRDLPVDRDAIPAGSRDVETAAAGSLQVRNVAGSLVVWGTIAADGRAEVRVRYPVESLSDTVDLGLRGVVARTRASVLVASRAPGRARLDSTWPIRPASVDQGSDRMMGVTTTRALRQGERFVVRVSDLPVASTWPARTLSGLGLALVALAIAALVVRRRGANIPT